MRRSIFPLNGIRITILLFVAVTLAFVISISSPRPAHAEGFLSGTVKCLVKFILPGECKGFAPQPEPAPVENPAPANPANPAPGSTPQSNASSGETPPTNNPDFNQQSSYEPIVVEEVALPAPAPLPKINNIDHTVATGSGGAQYLAYMNIHGVNATYGVKGEQTHQFALAETSHEGWKIAGIAWYWWALGVALIGGVISYGKYKLVKKNQLLSKAQ